MGWDGKGKGWKRSDIIDLESIRGPLICLGRRKIGIE